MEYVNFFGRLKRNLRSFPFSNTIIRESLATGFAYQIKLFFLYFLVYVIMFQIQVTRIIGDPESVSTHGNNFINLFVVNSEPMASYVGLLYGFQFLIVTYIGLSLVGWLIAGLVSKHLHAEIAIGDCYKIGIYSVTVPNLLLVIKMFFNIKVPFFMVLYLAITAFYAFKFIQYYVPTKDEGPDMSDFLSRRVKEKKSI